MTRQDRDLFFSGQQRITAILCSMDINNTNNTSTCLVVFKKE
jgi:hypothetical protein